MKPKITVIVPTLNVASYIRECMDSIINQTLDELEILVIDAYSTDGTYEILEEYAARDKRIRLLEDKKRSTGYAKNLGIEKAMAPYISIVEPDDFIESDMMEKLYWKAEETGADVVKGGFDTFIGGVGERFIFPKTVTRYVEDYGKIYMPRQHVKCFQWVMFEWLGIYRKSFLERYHIRHNETPGAAYQDIGYWFLVFAYASKVCLIKDVFYHYRYDNPNASIKKKDNVFQTYSEYLYIREILQDKTEIWEKVYPAFCREFYRSNKVVYDRLDDKLKPMLSDKMYEVLSAAKQENVLDESLFEQREKEMLKKLLCSARAFDAYCYAKQNEQKNLLGILKNKCKRFPSVVIFGAGSYGTNMHYTLQKAGVQIAAYVDNDKKKWNRMQNGLKIYSIEKCEEFFRGCLYLIANKCCGLEMAQGLGMKGIAEERIELCDVVSLVRTLI